MWEHELSRYRNQMTARGLARQTVRHRGNLAAQMFGYLSAAGLTDLRDVTTDHVDAYLGYLASGYRTAKGRPISTRHLRGHFLCVKDFFAWLVREGRILRSPYGLRRSPKVLPGRLPVVLTPEEVVRVLESADPRTLRRAISKLHTLSARELNRQDNQPGRKVWFQYFDTHITFPKSYLPRLKYVHQNPVHHGVTNCAENYPWCSAAWFARTARTAFRATVEGFKTDKLSVEDAFVPEVPAPSQTESGVKPPHSK